MASLSLKQRINKGFQLKSKWDCLSSNWTVFNLAEKQTHALVFFSESLERDNVRESLWTTVNHLWNYKIIYFFNRNSVCVCSGAPPSGSNTPVSGPQMLNITLKGFSLLQPNGTYVVPHYLYKGKWMIKTEDITEPTGSEWSQQVCCRQRCAKYHYIMSCGLR